MGIMTLSPRRMRRRLILITPCITQGHPRVHTRTMMLLQHTAQEEIYFGIAGNELHLGQKPKLGGRYTDNPLIYISYLVGTLFIHVSFSFVVSLVYFSSVVSLLFSFGGCYYCSNLYSYFLFRLCAESSL